jgi:uncharacterized FAD-dependent dehydrogenase
METPKLADTEKLIHEILQGQKETIKANLLEQMKKSVGEHLTWNLREHIGGVTSEFIKNEMTEDIKALLIEQKPLILEGLKEAFVKIGAQVSIAMYETAAKNLSASSYNTSEILKKILQ